MHYALVGSQLRHGDIFVLVVTFVWGSPPKTKLADLQGLQRWALTIIESAKLKITGRVLE